MLYTYRPLQLIDLINREITYQNELTLSRDDDFIINEISISQRLKEGVLSLLSNNLLCSLILEILVRGSFGEMDVA